MGMPMTDKEARKKLNDIIQDLIEFRNNPKSEADRKIFDKSIKDFQETLRKSYWF